MIIRLLGFFIMLKYDTFYYSSLSLSSPLYHSSILVPCIGPYLKKFISIRHVRLQKPNINMSKLSQSMSGNV